jgi:uncharacterized protein (TIGR03067 family)
MLTDRDTNTGRQMMSANLLILAAGLLAAPVPKEDVTKGKIEGTWVVVATTRNGKPNDEIKGEKIIFKDGMVTVTSKKKDEKATYKVNTSKKPNEIDIMPDGEKESVLGIYTVEGDTLKMCFTKPGGQRPTEFSAKEGSPAMLIELKREKK